jgi:signal transduction histidine kinase
MIPLLVYKILMLLIIVLFLGLAVWVYFSNPKSQVNRLFFLLSFFLLFWIIGGYFFYISTDPIFATILGRLLLGVGLISLILLYLFSIYFPTSVQVLIPKRNYLIILFSGIILFLTIVFTNSVVQGVKITPIGTHPIFHPIGSFFYYGLLLFITGLILGNFLKKYLVLEKQEKLKAQYFLIGIFIFLGANLIFNIIFPIIYGDIRYWQIGNYSAIFFLGFTAYAIVKRGLFEIKVLLTSLLVALIAILLLVDLIVFTPLLWLQVLKGFTLIIFLFFGYYLIRSVSQEIKKRTELENLTLELEKANIELKKLDAAKSEFISIASHQLRTPLTAIKGYISMILEGIYGKLTEKAKKPMENVYQSNERLIKLVNDLLNLTKMEAGKLKLEAKLCSLEKITQGVVDELKVNAQKKNLVLKIEKPSESLPEIMLDENKLRQALLNIVDNAIKYTKEGEVVVKLNKIGNYQQIKVSDTGEGITEKEIKSLFQTFSRATAGTQLHIEGAGIGLYVAKKFIEMHQGKIWVESPGKGKGSTFYIRLPINQQPVISNQQPATSNQ